jgi:hypothetical protein
VNKILVFEEGVQLFVCHGAHSGQCDLDGLVQAKAPFWGLSYGSGVTGVGIPVTHLGGSLLGNITHWEQERIEVTTLDLSDEPDVRGRAPFQAVSGFSVSTIFRVRLPSALGKESRPLLQALQEDLLVESGH